MEKREKQQQYLFVIQQLTSRELKRKYARSVLGVLWSVLNPLLSMGVLSLIFSQMFRRTIENYPIYYLTGYLLWQAFTGTTNSAMTTLADNRTLLLKVKFPMELFVLTRGCTALVNLGYSFVAYGVMLLVFRVEVGWAALFLVPIVGCLFLFSLCVFRGCAPSVLCGPDPLDVLFGHLLPGGPALRAHPPGGGVQPPVPVYPVFAGGCDGGPAAHLGRDRPDGCLGRRRLPGRLGDLPGAAGKNLAEAVR